MLSSDYKNIMLLSLLCLGTFLITCSVFIFYFLPHYDENGKYSLFGKYYNKQHITNKKKIKNMDNKIKNMDKNKEKLKKLLNNYKTQNFSMNEKLKNFSEKYKNNQKNLQILETQNNNLSKNINVLKSQLNQQQEFIKNQNIEHKQENKQKQFIKKRQFSNVSKTNITNERPQLGNMFSKSLKKTTTTST